MYIDKKTIRIKDETTMKKFCLGLILIAIIIPTISSASAPSIDIEHFTNLATSRNVQISPDGKHLSVVLRRDGEDLLAIIERKTMKPKGVFGVHGNRKSVGKVYWVNNKRLVYTVNQSYVWNKSQFENGELIGVNVDGSQHETIFGYKSGKSQIDKRIKTHQPEFGHHEIIDLMKDDKKNILLAFYPWRIKGNHWISSKISLPILYILNIYSGKKRKISTLPLPHADSIVDNFGVVRFASGKTKSGDSIVFYRESTDDKWNEFLLEDFQGKNITPLSFSKDNESIYFTANVKKNTRALFKYSIKTRIIKKIFHDENIDISLLIHDFSEKHIIAVGTDLNIPSYYYLDENNFKSDLHKKLLKIFKGSNVSITSTTTDENIAIVYIYSDTNPGDYYLFDTKKLKAKHLFKRHPQLDPKLLASTQSISFTARDGMNINGYLTKPTNPSNEKIPMVVLPHGGPHGVRDYWGYDWEVQLLANNGYAVLQINFRGSGGFGTSFEESGHGNWGTSMQDDITDGTLDLINKGIVDPERICIYGASYGGYAALTGAVREPELYKCVIGSMGVYNLPMMFKKGDIPQDERGLNYLSKILGNDIEIQKLRSPVYNVDKVKAEVLLIHGAKDNRAPIAQAKSLMKAFDKVGKKYQWLKLNDEAHGYYDEENRKYIYSKILNFLDENIGKTAMKLIKNK
jgi:dipeptidyl aminopeptidase/acylaminoacyl peptidase